MEFQGNYGKELFVQVSGEGLLYNLIYGVIILFRLGFKLGIYFIGQVDLLLVFVVFIVFGWCCVIMVKFLQGSEVYLMVKVFKIFFIFMVLFEVYK